MKEDLRKRLAACHIAASDILLPREDVDMSKWAVVACDQFTSQKDYWDEVARITKDVPSTYHMILPECDLDDADDGRIAAIDKTMEDYLAEGVLKEHPDSFVLVERTCGGKSRYGLMVSLDLEAYSYDKDSRSPVRATEGTILSRIPPRKRIREGAPLELPHIMVLISDEKRSVIEPLAARKDSLRKLYDTDLMLGGGHVRGYLIDSDEDINLIASALESIKASLDPANPLMYAMGDGNHSLATAKSLYEDLKEEAGEEEALRHPARYALVEIENIFDPALLFEPIHRVFFNTGRQTFEDELTEQCSSYCMEDRDSLDELQASLEEGGGDVRFGLVDKDGFHLVILQGARKALAASVIQDIIDTDPSRVDYIHGADVTARLGSAEGNLGIILPEISKEGFFDAVLKDGAFPRKTFSIGHAEEKRYYLEARRIR